jgi:hypothetical protein
MSHNLTMPIKVAKYIETFYYVKGSLSCFDTSTGDGINFVELSILYLIYTLAPLSRFNLL